MKVRLIILMLASTASLLSCMIFNPPVDYIVVNKSERTLHLVKDELITQSFPVALGQSPKGHKRKEGDSRTPEGWYYIDGRNPDSDFFLSLHISYPNEEDEAFARRAGYSPGGHIVIHGEPNERKPNQNLKEDWTEGCIAVTNENMEVLWGLIPEGTPILINP